MYFSMSSDLAVQNLVVKDLKEVYEGITFWPLFLHETEFPLSYGPKDLKDKKSFQYLLIQLVKTLLYTT